MDNVNSIKEYGIPDGILIGSFGLDRLNDVITEIYEHKDNVLRVATTGETLTFEEFTPYHVTGTVKLYENALVISLEEHNDANAKHEDAGKSELYIFDDDIIYIVTEVDPRINNDYKINTTKSKRCQERLSNLVNIPEELKSATTLSEKIKFFFTSGKRKKLKVERDNCLNKINGYLDRLLDINIENGK